MEPVGREIETGAITQPASQPAADKEKCLVVICWRDLPRYFPNTHTHKFQFFFSLSSFSVRFEATFSTEDVACVHSLASNPSSSYTPRSSTSCNWYQ